MSTIGACASTQHSLSPGVDDLNHNPPDICTYSSKDELKISTPLISDTIRPFVGFVFILAPLGFLFLVAWWQYRKAAHLDCRIHTNTHLQTNKMNHNKNTNSFTFHDYLRYRLDNYLSSSPWSKVVMLLGATFLLIMSGGFLLSVFSSEDDDFANSTWIAWTFVADPGTHADAEGAFVRLISFLITIGGMLIFALMIGITSESIGNTVDGFKKGRSRVLEHNHSLILGWNDKSLAIIQQIALANDSEGGGVIVVLAEQEKVFMEESLQAATRTRYQGLDLHGTQVIFRSGNPLLEYELRKVNVLAARAIIVLSQDKVDPDESDSHALRQVLSLKMFGSRLRCHVVVEMEDVDNCDLVELVAQDFTEIIVAHDMIGRLMIQCARAPGLANVIENIMGFEGSEFYIKEWKELVGLTFEEITCRFDDAIPVGIKLAEPSHGQPQSVEVSAIRNSEPLHNGDAKLRNNPSRSSIIMNPSNSLKIRPGDKIIVLAEDDDSYEVNNRSYQSHVGLKHGSDSILRRLPTINDKRTEKLLFCGWRRDMADMIMQLDQLVKKGSELWLFNLVPPQERIDLLKDQGNKVTLNTCNLTVRNAVGNPIVRRHFQRLEELDWDGKSTGDTITLDEFDSLLILADSCAVNAAGMEQSDSRCLASLLIMQDIQRKLCLEKEKHLAKKGTSSKLNGPLTEILDSRTRALLKVADCKGYVMSNVIVSAAIAQVAEDRDMNVVLSELLSAKGNNVFLREIGYFFYLSAGRKKMQDQKNTTIDEDFFSFWDVALKARERHEIAIGYKPAEVASTTNATEWILNPSDKHKKRKWNKDDVIFVIAKVPTAGS